MTTSAAPSAAAPAVLLDQVIEALYARHTLDGAAAKQARQIYEERRGKVHQDDELWEAWSAAFVEWFVVEHVHDGGRPAAAATLAALDAEGDAARPRAEVVRALLTSQRSLFEVLEVARGGVALLDLLGGARFEVAEQRALHGVEIGDVAELRLVGVGGEVHFGRTFIYHPRAARPAIVERARAMMGQGASRRDVIDHVAQLRVQVTRYRHMPAARVYELGSRIMG